MQCPNCQHTQENEITCGACGIYFEKWRQRAEKSKQVTTTIYAEPPHSHTFKIFALGALAASLILLAIQKLGTEEKNSSPQTVARITPAAHAIQQNSQRVISAQRILINVEVVSNQNDIAEQKVAAKEVAAYQKELQTLRYQKTQIAQAIETTRRNYDRSNRTSRDEAQEHAYQISQQEQEQQLRVQLDAVNAQIDTLMSHRRDSH